MLAVQSTQVPVLDAFFWVTCLILVAAGASKLVSPAATGATLTALGMPGGELSARALGAAELVVGLAGLAVGGTITAVLVALGYAAFAAVVVAARRRDLPSCGCFGARPTPPSPIHVAVNVACAAVAAAAAVTSPGAVADSLEGTGGTGVVVVGLALVAAALVVAVDTVVAEVSEAAAAARD